MVAMDLERFVEAQRATYDDALEQLRAGRKTSHWMWFVLPQLRGLGRSWTAEHYGIASREEARAYVDHPVLGDRLRTCAAVLLTVAPTRTAIEVLGPVDALKLRSSMTLFAAVAPEDDRYAAVLEAWYDGELDPLTLALLASDAGT